jgi:hypothetical protein
VHVVPTLVEDRGDRLDVVGRRGSKHGGRHEASLGAA